MTTYDQTILIAREIEQNVDTLNEVLALLGATTDTVGSVEWGPAEEGVSAWFEVETGEYQIGNEAEARSFQKAAEALVFAVKHYGEEVPY